MIFQAARSYFDGCLLNFYFFLLVADCLKNMQALENNEDHGPFEIHTIYKISAKY